VKEKERGGRRGGGRTCVSRVAFINILIFSLHSDRKIERKGRGGEGIVSQALNFPT